MTEVRFACIDLETTGMDPPHEVIETGRTDVMFDTQTLEVVIGATESALYKPTVEMASDNVAVHHLTPKMLAGFEVCSAAHMTTLCNSPDVQFFVAANVAFEKKWITPEFTDERHWICTVKVAAQLFPEAPSHSNQAMRYELGLDDLSESLAMPPHRAGPDSYVTANILAHFLKLTSVKQMVKWTMEPRFMARCPIGKNWRGKRWEEIELSGLQWILRQQDMEEDILHNAKREVDRRVHGR